MAQPDISPGSKAYLHRTLRPVTLAVHEDIKLRRALAEYAVDRGADILKINDHLRKIIFQKRPPNGFLAVVFYEFGMERGLLSVPTTRTKSPS